MCYIPFPVLLLSCRFVEKARFTGFSAVDPLTLIIIIWTLLLFLIGRIFSARDVITADYTIIMSRTRKVTNYHVLYARRAWFLWVIMSTFARFVLLAVSKEAETGLPSFRVPCIIKQLLDSVFVISRIIIKITISSLVIGLKISYFPLIRLPSCYRTVFYWIVCYWTICYRTV